MRSLIFLEKDICEVIDAPLERGRPDDPGDLTSATHTSGQRITKGRRFFLSLSLFKDICAINGKGFTVDLWDIEDLATYTIAQCSRCQLKVA